MEGHFFNISIFHRLTFYTNIYEPLSQIYNLYELIVSSENLEEQVVNKTDLVGEWVKDLQNNHMTPNTFMLDAFPFLPY